MLRKRRAHLWLVFGVLAGLGFLNKPSIALFLVALCAGLMVTPQQRTISSPWVLAAFLEIVLLALPFLHWQSQHGFAMVQFLAVGAKNRMDLVAIAAFCFLGFARIFVQPVSHSRMAIVPASTPVIDHFGSERSPMRKSPYLIDRHPLVDSHGFSCTPAPWGGITAVNLNTLKEVWEKPLGTMIPGQQTGIRNFGGPIVTASGLVITAGAEDSALRIFDSATGEELQTVALPVPAVATPMTYTIAGRQYIVVAAGGHGDKTVPLGDALIAFAVN
jgi:Dolichyl-phosphate-mannose-protein mannosyltransferase